ncbi:MAG: sugar ABC transporter permease [Blautia sp.]|uniref:carbohydrate ABC transporter permease n=1 Tax=Blautia sp. TaxID=1955243 RepID=UPI0027076860|nr:sugar ABC transporter permease [Blautia sp.]MDO4448020.1 sugar ABC transporter permease [Lachnospiraceae bacterium]MED9882436.1 sugar ABC transporter permease [Blautia sp.]
MNKVLGNKKAITLFTLPAILLFTALVFIPLIWSFTYTFFSGQPGLDFSFCGLKNYMQIFKDPTLLITIKNNLLYVVCVGGMQILLGFLIAMLINFGVKRHQNLVRSLLFIPVVLPGVAVAQMFLKMYAITPQYGLLNSLLDMIGLDSLITAWTGNPKTAMLSLFIMDIWKAVGMYILVFYSGIIELPEDSVEAARIDGANTWQIITKVQIPQLKPVFRMALIICITACFKVYDSPMALTGGGPGTATMMPSMYMYNMAFNYRQFGYGSVLAVLILIECALFTAAVGRIFRNKD